MTKIICYIAAQNSDFSKGAWNVLYTVVACTNYIKYNYDFKDCVWGL